MSLPLDYRERVYAGVLGKIIGVYVGRPVESWSHERIEREIGEIWGYIHHRFGKPVVEPDDDISGTFTFLRALEAHGYDSGITAEQIGHHWLNTIIENRTILWWGGLGNSTEHTAFLRLQNGIEAPLSGSMALNTQVVAEQIGAQIFIDGWGMICPGDPERAADYARRAGSVSHDGEAIYGAQVIAAMVAEAFVESNIDQLIDRALEFIPWDSTIARLIADIREWHAAEPDDWRATRSKIEARYGYDKYGGNCHMIPNHGLIIHALLHGNGDFQRSLMIVNTCGWDTDCNSGNVGAILGVRGGLAGLETGPDWRGPVADRMYLPTADGGRCITDAVRETDAIVNTARRLQGEEPLIAKGGARFHFSLPGSVQGFRPQNRQTTVTNRDGHLVIGLHQVAPGAPGCAVTPTFFIPEALNQKGYDLVASPTIYPGQTLRAKAELRASQAATVRLILHRYNVKDQLVPVLGPPITLNPHEEAELTWTVPDVDGYPITEVGVQVESESRLAGELVLDFLTWEGTPDVVLRRPPDQGPGNWGQPDLGHTWRRAWVNGVDDYAPWWPEAFRTVQNRGTGLLIQGTQEWTDYRVEAEITPHMFRRGGIAARVQGMKRYLGLLLLEGGELALVKQRDRVTTVLARAEVGWQPTAPVTLALDVEGNQIRGFLNGTQVLDATDDWQPFPSGAIALVIDEGRMATEAVRISPLR